MELADLTLREALFTAGKEGLLRMAYKDSVSVLTWGFGVTSKSGHSVERYRNNPQTYERCAEIYIWLLRRYLSEVVKAFEGYELKPHERAAALSFHWNTGAIGTAQWVQDVKAGKMTAARSNIMNWRSPASIIPRREAERDLFFDAKWPAALKDEKNLGKVFVNEYTRLTSAGTPDWRSAKKVNVTPYFKAFLEPKKAAPVRDGAVGAAGVAAIWLVIENLEAIISILKGLVG